MLALLPLRFPAHLGIGPTPLHRILGICAEARISFQLKRQTGHDIRNPKVDVEAGHQVPNEKHREALAISFVARPFAPSFDGRTFRAVLDAV